MGAGPTGLGAAWRLEELKHENWLLIDQLPNCGGLATSYLDAHGFTWDIAVHVAHSHYPYVDDLFEKVLPDGFASLERRAWIRTENAWVPYPFQYNFHHLPLQSRQECLDGLLDPNRNQTDDPPRNFLDWICRYFGEGIANRFMIPYNRKIWSTDPKQMSCTWLGDRVPQVDIQRVQSNLTENRDDVTWGPNYAFKYPKRGGTGAIWNAMLGQLPSDRIRLGIGLMEVDYRNQIATLSDGSKLRYSSLISTIPIPSIVRMVGEKSLIDQSARLRHTHVQVACVACDFPLPNVLRDKTWIYCPEEFSFFYRVTPFSNFSPYHVPDPMKQCSFLCEISVPGGTKPWDLEVVESRTIESFQALGLAPVSATNSRFFHIDAPYGYPVPTLDRDAIINTVIPQLDALNIYSRGRFGLWKYEVSNMDHSIMQGVEVVDRILHGKDETTWIHPEQVNSMQSIASKQVRR